MLVVTQKAAAGAGGHAGGSNRLVVTQVVGYGSNLLHKCSFCFWFNAIFLKIQTKQLLLIF